MYWYWSWYDYTEGPGALSWQMQHTRSDKREQFYAHEYLGIV